MKKPLRSLRLFCTVFALVGPSTVFSQVVSTHQRKDPSFCQSAAADVQRPPDANGGRHYHFLADLYGCPDIGARVLAAEWEHPPHRTSDVVFLGEVSSQLQDQRILAAATRVARNTAYTRVVRLAAIRTLIGQFDPDIAVGYTLDKPLQPIRGGKSYVMLGSTADGRGANPGTHPLTAADSTGIIATFRQIGQADPDNVVRQIAAYLAQRFAANDLPPTKNRRR